MLDTVFDVLQLGFGVVLIDVYIEDNNIEFFDKFDSLIDLIEIATNNIKYNQRLLAKKLSKIAP